MRRPEPAPYLPTALHTRQVREPQLVARFVSLNSGALEKSSRRPQLTQLSRLRSVLIDANKTPAFRRIDNQSQLRRESRAIRVLPVDRERSWRLNKQRRWVSGPAEEDLRRCPAVFRDERRQCRPLRTP